MSWDSGLTEEQRRAASHIGSHARLLAGPGTGKTRSLTRRIAYLLTVRKVTPAEVLAMTFTRAAAFVLRREVSRVMGGSTGGLPRISTLHSFALRQLLRNAAISDLPEPLRIADDFEERWIIVEELKHLLGYKVSAVEHLFNDLSADWQTLAVDRADWEEKFPDARFIGAWREHRNIYGYTLRSELVYQLKKCLERVPDFRLEGPPRYLLVDEYQDLNPCDLAIIKAIVDRGAELYGSGDDDQSIYGFRHAYPEGIRRFDRDYPSSINLSLEECQRCDREFSGLANMLRGRTPEELVRLLELKKQRRRAVFIF